MNKVITFFRNFFNICRHSDSFVHVVEEDYNRIILTMKAFDRFCSAFLSAIVKRMRELLLTQSPLPCRIKVSHAYVSKDFPSKLLFAFVNAARFAKDI